MPISIEGQILGEVRRTLIKDRAVATGIGLFSLIIKEEEDKHISYPYGKSLTRKLEVLLRRRLERESLYQQDLSGKWELVGGGAEISHFESAASGQTLADKYQGSIFNTLAQEVAEESGLKLINLPDPLLLFPAFLWRKYVYKDKEKNTEEDSITIDTAFSLPIPYRKEYLEDTEESLEKLKTGETMWIPEDKLDTIDFIGPRMIFLVKGALQIYKLLYL